tara:strand:- start:59 stop:427 length:369 start_codon:yes stop_codon:yes gene_type:complete
MVLSEEEKKERKKIYNKRYKEKHKEKVKECNRQYNQKNKQKKNIWQKEWNKTEKGRKLQRFNDWKRRGLIGDYEEIYLRYIGTKVCDECGCSFKTNRKCMDHCHITGEFRNILCNACNIKRK